MDFGIVTAKVDEIGYITHAENLGYTHCWVTDSQMIRCKRSAVSGQLSAKTRGYGKKLPPPQGGLSHHPACCLVGLTAES